MLPNSKTSPSLPFRFPPPIVVQCSSPTAYQIRWRQGRCHLLFLRVERTTDPVGCSTFHTQSGHLQDILLLLFLPSLSSLSSYGLLLLFVRFIFPCFIAPLFLYTHTTTHTHTETQWHTHWETVHFHWLHGYNKSHTQRQQLHLLPLTVVERVSLAHTPFLCIASGIRDLYIFVTSSHCPSFPSPSTNSRFKILSSAAHLVARLTSR